MCSKKPIFRQNHKVKSLLQDRLVWKGCTEKLKTNFQKHKLQLILIIKPDVKLNFSEIHTSKICFQRHSATPPHQSALQKTFHSMILAKTRLLQANFMNFLKKLPTPDLQGCMQDSLQLFIALIKLKFCYYLFACNLVNSNINSFSVLHTLLVQTFTLI